MCQIIKLNQVVEMTALARSTIYQYVSEKRFPAPIKIGERSSGWVLSEVESWLSDRISERDQENKNA
jgi:prophage regulatory protein